MSRSILTNTIYKIIENLNELPGFWQNTISFDGEIDSHYAISEHAFGNAIKGIVEKYLAKYSEEETVKILTSKINKIWEIVIAKWPKCFVTRDYYNLETKQYDIIKTKYNPNFCLCNVYGVSAIMSIYEEVCEFPTPEDLDILKFILVNSPIIYKNWDTCSGQFSPDSPHCSVEFKDIAEYVKGNKKL